jgi:phosphoenolpyruvate synthase/pyruvate phosphate dikinase
MSLLLSIDLPPEHIREEAGPKAAALALMGQAGVAVPKTAFVPARIYSDYLRTNGLHSRILIELGRKSFEDMRWEEMWDASLRIRNMFLNTPMPADMGGIVGEEVSSLFADAPLAVRSSGLAEDTGGASFAGLHESYLNVRGPDNVLRHVVLVWASLWSDAALLYRQELSLSADESAMGVIIQEMIEGEKSGVAFGVAPDNADHAVVESVYGLNKGLVDGDIEPDHWVLNRRTGRILSHNEASRKEVVVPSEGGVRTVSLEEARADMPPLSDGEVASVYQTVVRLGELFGKPQDVEWTLRRGTLYVLQSRPVTVHAGVSEDNRSWYLSLKRTFPNLRKLGARIEGELLPAMEREADELAAIDLSSTDQETLAREIERRQKILDRWRTVYWDEFIPFAHGARLFGQVYNDRLKPDDPFEFIALLTAEDMRSMQRNELLHQTADSIRTRMRNPTVEGVLKDPQLETEIDRLLPIISGLTSSIQGSAEEKSELTGLLVRMAQNPPGGREDSGKQRDKLERRFIEGFDESKRDYARELLDIGRKSYRLRDDDNLYLGRIESELERALGAAQGKLSLPCAKPQACTNAEEIISLLRGQRPTAARSDEEAAGIERGAVRARQLRGQPAGQGIARGKARVVSDSEELFSFEAGEILVCDAIDPNMTLIVPLAAAIVERRGGMLIHGAIIAREYGIPCVTGVPDAARNIRTGDLVTVDGYYGLVTLHTGTYGED